MSDIEPTSLAVGFQAKLLLELVPKTSMAFKDPSSQAKSKLENPDALRFDFPIEGTCKNFPAEVGCQLFWLVAKAAGNSQEGPIDAKMKVSGGNFKIEVDGHPPQLDIIQHRLVGDGTLGYRIVPDFPHAEPAEKAPTFPFNNPLSFQISKPSDNELPLGSRIRFRPRIASVLQKAVIELEITEGGGDAEHPACAITRSWKNGESGDMFWAVGFADPDCCRFSYPESREKGDLAFRWSVYGSTDGGATRVKQFENLADFASVKRPRLESFDLTFEAHWYQDALTTQGRITGFSPDAHVNVEIAVFHVDDLLREDEPDLRSRVKRVALAPDGAFKATLATRTLFVGGTVPDPTKIFAVLTFPAARISGAVAPMDSCIAFDQAKFPGFKKNDLVFSGSAEWICSEEACKITKTPTQLIEDDFVKRVFYYQGQVDNETHVKLKEILGGTLTVERDACPKGVAIALQRALTYLGYPTGSAGQVSIDGQWGAGGNMGYALFLREKAKKLLLNKANDAITEETLIFESKDNASTVSKVKTFPIVPVAKAGFEVLLKEINATRKNRAVYLGNPLRAAENLDLVHKFKPLTVKEIIDKYRTMIINAAQTATGKGCPIKPTWIAAIMSKETDGIPRFKFEHHKFQLCFHKPGTEEHNPGNVAAGELTNFAESRYWATSFGFGQLMGSNYACIGAKSPLELFFKEEQAQIDMIACYIAETTNAKIKSLVKDDSVASADGVRPLAAYYNGPGYEKNDYHNKLFAKLREAKATW